MFGIWSAMNLAIRTFETIRTTRKERYDTAGKSTTERLERARKKLTTLPKLKWIKMKMMRREMPIETITAVPAMSSTVLHRNGADIAAQYENQAVNCEKNAVKRLSYSAAATARARLCFALGTVQTSAAEEWMHRTSSRATSGWT
jgi:hypothetical protein